LNEEKEIQMFLNDLLQIIDDEDTIELLTENPINQGHIVECSKKNIDYKYINCKVEEIFVSENFELCIKIDFRDWEY
jgi:hypothetical protein